MNEKDKIIEHVKRSMDKIHGNGLNYDYRWGITNKKIILRTFYHVMSDEGYYMDTIPVRVAFPIDNLVNFKIRCRNVGKYYDGIRDYLTDTIHMALIMK